MDGFRNVQISPKVSDIIRKTRGCPEIIWQWTNQCWENSVLLLQYKKLSLSSPSLSVFLLPSVSFNLLLCFLFYILGFFNWIIRWWVSWFFIFIVYFLSFCSMGCRIKELCNEWRIMVSKLGFGVFGRWLRSGFVFSFYLGFLVWFWLGNKNRGSDPSFEFFCSRALFCVGEVENWHLNQSFGQIVLKLLRFCTSILSLRVFWKSFTGKSRGWDLAFGFSFS